MNRWGIIGLILLCAGAPLLHADELYPFELATQRNQFQHVLRDLRCLVCQNQDLVDSNAQLAKNLRQKVYQLVKEGQSDSDIMHYLTERYGDYILFKPPVKAATWFLWVGPWIFLIVGLWVFLRATRHE